MAALPDHDSQETKEWLDALDSVLEHEGPERAHFLLEKLIEKARRSGAYLPYSAKTAYVNTIPPGSEEKSPGDHEIVPVGDRARLQREGVAARRGLG